MSRSGGSRVLAHLAQEEANAVRLYLRYKGYHWNVGGPMFRELHLLFDEHAAIVLETVDPLAERQRMLGAAAPYISGELDAVATVPAEDGLPPTVRGMVDRLREAHRTIVDGMHDGFRAADAEGDPGTADLFARLVQAHEKMDWVLRELAAPVATLPDDASRLLRPRDKGAGFAPGGLPHAAPSGPARQVPALRA